MKLAPSGKPRFCHDLAQTCLQRFDVKALYSTKHEETGCIRSFLLWGGNRVRIGHVNLSPIYEHFRWGCDWCQTSLMHQEANSFNCTAKIMSVSSWIIDARSERKSIYCCWKITSVAHMLAFELKQIKEEKSCRSLYFLQDETACDTENCFDEKNSWRFFGQPALFYSYEIRCE